MIFVYGVLGFVWSCSTIAEPLQLPRTHQFTLSSSTDIHYDIVVQLPQGYQNDTNKSYPVVYITDAPYAFPLVASALRPASNAGEIQSAILVGLGYQQGVDGVTSRIHDYTPSHDTSWQRSTGGADAYLGFIGDVVKPYINKTYRADQQQEIFIGQSLGGLLAAHALISQPNLFDSYLISSPSVWFHDDALLKLAAQQTTQPTQVYISVGELETPQHGLQHDMRAGAQRLYQMLIEQAPKSTQVSFHTVANARHTTAFPTAVAQGLYDLLKIADNRIQRVKVGEPVGRSDFPTGD